MRDEACASTNTIQEQTASAATGSKEQVAEHAKLEFQKVKVDSWDKALNVSSKEVTAVKGVADEQSPRFDFADARIAELKSRRNEASE